MQLIIKSSSSCDFECSFCSSSELQIPITSKLHPVLKEYILELNPDEIIVNGGEPLLMPLSWWYDLLELGDWKLTTISNMMQFYHDPLKFKELFNNNRVTVGASFQTDGGRIYKGKNLTLDWFRDVNDKFVKITNYPLFFISVLDYSNYSSGLDLVFLAKELNSICRLNNLRPLGKSYNFFPIYKMFELYLKIIEMNLDTYEYHTKNRFKSSCPYNILQNCNDHIRVCYIDNKNKLHTSNCDDIISSKEKLEPFNSKNIINPECFSCELMRLCNGCHTSRTYIKRNFPEEHCKNMKKLKQKIMNYGFLL